MLLMFRGFFRLEALQCILRIKFAGRSLVMSFFKKRIGPEMGIKNRELQIIK